MIDFDPKTQEAFLSQDLAMKFLVWAAYYNGIVPEENRSFGTYGLFASVAAACAQMKKAKQLVEPCPFGEASLNELFGKL